MVKEYCSTCGQELPLDDITEECELKWVRSGDSCLVEILHRGKHIIFLAPECEVHQPWIAGYRIKVELKTRDGSGWWFQVLKVRR